MLYRNLGHSGLRVSEIALGSWLTLGSAVDGRRAERLVARALDLGVNLFDTADVYARGAAEEALGRALRRVPRAQVVIATKCFFPMSEAATDRGLSRKHVFDSLHASLRRLGCDYVDLHQCHRADPETPIAETVRAYDDLIRQGKLLYWGVSQWTGAQVAEACRVADALGAVRPISNQPEYSLLRRQIEAEVLPVCREHGVGQIVFSPLGQGVLTGKYSGGRRPTDSRAGDAKRNHFMNDYLDPACLARIDELEPLARELGMGLARLALAWCLRDASVASVIVGATREEQIEENCLASGSELPEALLRRIDAILPAPARA
jgi:voltage-dependent potassium channel beta subunit